jgi:hypothetical protein
VLDRWGRVYEGEPPPPPEGAAPGTKGAPLPPSVVEAKRRVGAARACPHRGAKIGDGCNCLHACALGRGSFKPGEVSLNDCISCPMTEPRT